MDERPDDDSEHLPSLTRLTRDLVKASVTLTETEARYLVDAYYLSQDDRKRAHNQVRTMTKEPHTVISWLATQSELLEKQIKRALDAYTDSKPEGRWLKSIYGIGPVLTAGFLAHIDIEKSPTVGHIYSFAGIAGSGQKPWEKGKRRPFNADLRVLQWKCGQTLMKFSNEPECTYGHIYRERKAFEVERNDRGYNAAASAEILATKNFKKETDAYKAYSIGKLPPAHVDARARRYAVKILLSHLHCVMYFYKYGKLPANPYALDRLGHTHFVKMPNVDMVPGLEAALKAKGFI